MLNKTKHIVLSLLLLLPQVIAEASVDKSFQEMRKAVKDLLENPQQIAINILVTVPFLFVAYKLFRWSFSRISQRHFTNGRWRFEDIAGCIAVYLLSQIVVFSLAKWFFMEEGGEITYLQTLWISFISLLLSCSFIYFYLTIFYQQKHKELGLTHSGIEAKTYFYTFLCYFFFVPFYLTIFLISHIIFIWLDLPIHAQPIAERILEAKGFLFAFSIFTAVVLAPLFEEFLFRMFLYTGLRNVLGSPLWAAILSSALFALAHSNGLGLLPIFCIGLFLVILYERTQCIWVPIFAHSLHNTATLINLLYMI